MEKDFVQKRRACRFCHAHKAEIDYKELQTLKAFLTDRGKIIPRRISGNCAGHQRLLTSAIKRARTIAFLSFAGER